METHALSLSQEYTNFTNHFLNVLSSRFQSITHKLSLLTKLYYSYLLTICSQSCYTLKVLVAQWCLTLCDPWTVAHQAPLGMEWSRQGYWSGLPFPSPGDLPNPGIEPRSPALQADSLPSELPGKPNVILSLSIYLSAQVRRNIAYFIDPKILVFSHLNIS